MLASGTDPKGRASPITCSERKRIGAARPLTRHGRPLAFGSRHSSTKESYRKEKKKIENLCCGLGWCQDNGNWSNSESKFDFLATRQQLVEIGEEQQKIKIVRTNQQSNLRGSCQSNFSLPRHLPSCGLHKNQRRFNLYKNCKYPEYNPFQPKF